MFEAVVYRFLVNVPASHAGNVGSNPAWIGASRTRGVMLMPFYTRFYIKGVFAQKKVAASNAFLVKSAH